MSAPTLWKCNVKPLEYCFQEQYVGFVASSSDVADYNHLNTLHLTFPYENLQFVKGPL